MVARSLLVALCVGSAVLWVRSYRGGDVWRWGRVSGDGKGSRWVVARCDHGRLEMTWDHLSFEGPGDFNRHATLSLPTPFGLRHDTGSELFLSRQWTVTPAGPPNRPFWQWVGFSGGSLRSEDAIPTGGTVRYERRSIGFPVWLPCLLPLIPLGVAVARSIRRRRRRRCGRCVVCGYDLRGIADRCPECGSAVAESRIADMRTIPLGPRFSRRRLAFAGLGLACLVAGAWGWERSSGRPTAPSGRGSWLAIGDDVYQEEDRMDEGHAGTWDHSVRLGTMPEWFVPSGEPATPTESEANLCRLDVRAASVRPIFAATSRSPGTVPLFSSRPLAPADLPEESQGIRLNLGVRPAAGQSSSAPRDATSAGGAADTKPTTPAAPPRRPPLLFTFRLSASSRAAFREVEHRHTNFSPFLVTFHIDGRPVTVEPPGAYGWMGGVNYLIDIVPKGAERSWTVTVEEESVHKLLPDDGPHRVQITAAFCERQYEPESYSYMSLTRRTDLLEDGSRPARTPVLIRSNTVVLTWTGSGWKAGE